MTATMRVEAAERPYTMQAQAAFDDLPARDRNEIFLELMATGDFNAMASSEFGGRLYDATASFQAEHGIEPSGVLTPETRQALSAVGGRVFNSWGFEFLDHPFAPASVVVPGRFGLARSPTQHGFALKNRNRTMSIDFSFFADNEPTLSTVFDKLTRTASGRRVDMKVIRPTFLAVAGGTDKTSSYSRYIGVRGGVAGFTLSWNNETFPNGVRVAVVMANELYPRHMVSDTGQQADIFEGLPSDAAPDALASPDSMAFSEAATLSARQAASREQYGPTATAAAARIAAEVNGFTDSPEDQSQAAVHKFPNFAALFRNDLGDRWEKMSENAELADYGVADWKGRSLETVFSRLNIRLKNRILGDYKDHCYVFGQINDTEFDATREHVVLPCNDGADLAAWQTGHGFRSFWKLR